MGREDEAARFPCPGLDPTVRHELFITCMEGSSLEMQAFVKHRQRQSSSLKVATNILEQSLHFKKRCFSRPGSTLGSATPGNVGQGPNTPFTSSCCDWMTLGRVWLLFTRAFLHLFKGERLHLLSARCPDQDPTAGKRRIPHKKARYSCDM